ncbi:class I SAM-dependent methyltransferase [Enterococcus hulanensis]|uniref:Class I SAM-dependent methyltransferase n=1 Tax=Enterococcus hulanensis TaxID=2559929 RepID=A0ABU3EWV8_9ENTE|nr:class I SAM-dependent methyltransferase [Enterococcus hulanensis]MDT2599344.1 class I SAM-dependent methyltransferase [Enterococcus hulanensis]MDT2608751.1 class I SAM-dependent methyltransferase [Enterococcus hulanensis]MDT2616506.1 class I SAM-dependent methyltransferase [Enterococcus hulanensis]MDT2627454.1 class I SAM-dependent methyltransferase [Enterococcus hulanensis]MDT2657320.1 class I SAM-dependent methyltransferase [Enterococcus hulanensis]
MAYETFAFVYDEVMDDSLYQQWLDFSLRHLPKATNQVLELACGTGALAVEFAKKGFDVTGLDLSEEMLTLASDRAIQEDVSINWVAGDMLDLTDIGKYQAVTCFSDSLCYMQDATQVQQVFKGVYQLLEESGTFIFDVHSIYQIDEVFPDYSFHDQTEDFAFLWDSYSGDSSHSIEHFLTFFVKKEGEMFERFDELHKERTYSLEMYQKMLTEVGFKVEVFADFTDDEPMETSKRWFFVCQK